jgi:hypothetical protein
MRKVFFCQKIYSIPRKLLLFAGFRGTGEIARSVAVIEVGYGLKAIHGLHQSWLVATGYIFKMY